MIRLVVDLKRVGRRSRFLARNKARVLIEQLVVLSIYLPLQTQYLEYL